jgi:hypothetical protein
VREKPITIILVVFAIVFVVIGIMYITILPRNLPSFMPGHVTKKPVAEKTTKTTHTSVTNASGATVTTKAASAKPKQPAKKAATKYYWKRGVASFFVAGVLLVVAWSISDTRKRRQRSPAQA